MILRQCEVCGKTWSVDEAWRWTRPMPLRAINYVTRARICDLCVECAEVIKDGAARAVREIESR